MCSISLPSFLLFYTLSKNRMGIAVFIYQQLSVWNAYFGTLASSLLLPSPLPLSLPPFIFIGALLLRVMELFSGGEPRQWKDMSRVEDEVLEVCGRASEVGLYIVLRMQLHKTTPPISLLVGMYRTRVWIHHMTRQSPA